MNNPTLETQSTRQDEFNGRTNPIEKGKSFSLAGLKSYSERISRFLRGLIERTRAAYESDEAPTEDLSVDDRLAILKTQCDYVRSCYREKLLESQNVLGAHSKALDTEIDQLLDSYGKLKEALKQVKQAD